MIVYLIEIPKKYQFAFEFDTFKKNININIIFT